MADENIGKVGPISVIGDNSQYVQSVVNLLRSINKRFVGQAIFNSAEPNKIAIVPNNSKDQCNAFAQSIPVVKGVARIEFSPGLQKSCKAIWWSDDETLLHEIIHGVFISRGVSLSDRDDEFYAVMLTNIYRSEKGVQPKGDKGLTKPINLRRDHGDSKMIGAEAAGFMKTPRHAELVRKLWFEPRLRQMCWMINRIKVFFNPVREMLFIIQKEGLAQMKRGA